jgi:hypothetical protein
MVMVFNATLTIFQLSVYHDDQFYWWRKPEYPEKTTSPKEALSDDYILPLTLIELYATCHL